MRRIALLITALTAFLALTALAQPTRWQPTGMLTWQWDLTARPDLTLDVQVYNIDTQIATAAQVAALEARGIKTIGYSDMSYEPGRPDSSILAPYRCAKYDGWPGQYWLDFRVPAVRMAMVERFKMIAAKGFDGVEADSVDHTGNAGNCKVRITRAQQLEFVKFLASEAHKLGLAFFLKNLDSQVAQLAPFVDGAVIEECHVYNECDVYSKALGNKLMLNAEYVGRVSSGGRYTSATLNKARRICPTSARLGLSTIIKKLDLTKDRYSCI